MAERLCPNCEGNTKSCIFKIVVNLIKSTSPESLINELIEKERSLAKENNCPYVNSFPTNPLEK